MTEPRNTPPPVPASPPVGWWDRAAIIALGGAGCALSYDALQQMAVAIHVRPQLSYLFPLVIDGFIAYGIRALLVMSTAPLRARLYTWALFATATTASIWANALHAVRLNQQTRHSGLRLGDHVVAVLSTIAPLALAGAVHLYILITRHHPARPGSGTHLGPGPDRPAALVPVGADRDGAIRTGPRHELQHPVRADHRAHLHDHEVKAERTADRGPEQADGSCGPADHNRADRPDRDHRGPADRRDGDRSPGGLRPAPHETAASRAEPGLEAADQAAAAPQSAADTGPAATAPAPKETSAGRPAPARPVADQGGDPTAPEQKRADPTAEAGDRTERRANQHAGADPDRGPTAHPGTALGDQPPHGTGGPDLPPDRGHRKDHADHADHADHESGPPAGTSSPAQDDRTGPDPEGAGDQPRPRTTDRTGDGPTRTAQEASDAAGLEKLLSIAREAALAEGRMTRRALRPYLNEAGVPISNRRFTELQRRLYADPKLAHLPRPGRRS